MTVQMPAVNPDTGSPAPRKWTAKAARFVHYQDKSGQWRWKLLAANNRIIADSGEAYTRERDVMRAIETVKLAVGKGR